MLIKYTLCVKDRAVYLKSFLILNRVGQGSIFLFCRIIFDEVLEADPVINVGYCIRSAFPHPDEDAVPVQRTTSLVFVGHASYRNLRALHKLNYFTDGYPVGFPSQQISSACASF